MKPSRIEMSLLVSLATRLRLVRQTRRRIGRMLDEEGVGPVLNDARLQELDKHWCEAFYGAELALHNALVAAKEIVYQGQGVPVFRTPKSAVACRKAKYRSEEPPLTAEEIAFAREAEDESGGC